MLVNYFYEIYYLIIYSLDLFAGGSLGTAGKAYVGGACGSFRTSINELGKSTVYAHELGHKYVYWITCSKTKEKNCINNKKLTANI